MKTQRIMRIFLMAVISMTFLTSALFAVETTTKEVKIKTNAFCEDCKTKIEGKLNKTDGVTESTLNMDDKIVTVKYDPAKTTPKKLMKSISSLGYKAANVVEKVKAGKIKDDKGCCPSSKGCKSGKGCPKEKTTD
jgi:periplasmic mercuric ion binding protein